MQKRNIILVFLILVVLGAIVYLYFKNKNTKEEENRQQEIMNELANYKPDPATARDPEEIMNELGAYESVKKENMPSNEDIMNSLKEIQ